MASQAFNELTRVLLVLLATKDVRVRLLMSNTTVDTQNDGMVNPNDFTTLDTCDDTTYADKSLASEAVVKDDANDRSEFDAADLTGGSKWTLTGDSTRDIVGMLLYEFVTDDTDHVVYAYLEFPSVVSKSATEISVTWNTEGILHLKNA